ncbi:Gpi1-domain-containing protein [Cystobasidium minutum MCA 4210]|uniref:Gpi1-domain-containing protein n=1 Tax=Cystobasidium minutum MCA 4210 TaxID=1397322 RepID=UPI0034CF814E|eukprot:jgi/Rhomi1/173992/fgenesh1_kg.7_\
MPEASHTSTADEQPAKASASFKTIFWARNTKSPGFLYGWKLTEQTLVIAGSLAAESSAEAQSFIGPRLSSLHRLVPETQQVQILGSCYSAVKPEDVANVEGHLVVCLDKGRPVMDSNFRFILYEPPDSRKLRFFSQTPLELDTTSYRIRQYEDTAEVSSRIGKQQDYVFPQPSLSAIDLEAVLVRLNSVKTVQRHLQQQRALSNRDTPSRLSPPLTKVQSPTNAVISVVQTCLSFILNCPLAGRNSLKDVSATAHQIDVRLRQAYTAPDQYRSIYHSKVESGSASRTQYISFYNMLWLIANDAIIGSAVTAFCLENNELIAQYIAAALKLWSVRRLQDTLLWLNDWPGGLKLNFELGTFFVDAFLWFTSVWEGIFLDRILLPHLPLIVKLVGLSASVGATMFLAMCSDFLSLSTLHLYIFYSMATTVFSFHTSAMGSLFNIFRGKKRNVIRNRIEPSEYTLDQLLVGAVLFTLAAFLLPTVLAYYLAFAVSRCAVIALHAGLEAMLAFLNHFPLFAMMLRVKDPQRLPGGLAFSVVNEGAGTYLLMKNNPIPAYAIFHQYWALWTSFSQHYSPVYLLGKIVTGRYINPIPRSRLTFVSRAGLA